MVILLGASLLSATFLLDQTEQKPKQNKGIFLLVPKSDYDDTHSIEQKCCAIPRSQLIDQTQIKTNKHP